MARPITYNPTAVRQALLETFWKRGYAETTLTDLEAATGLDRRQLYNGFGDKRAMFLDALDDFDGAAGRRFLAPLEANDAGLDAIAALLHTFVDLSATDAGRAGCMACNTAREDIARDCEVRSFLDGYFARIRNAYANALGKARHSGTLAIGDDRIGPLADLLLGTHVALCVLSRAAHDQASLRAMADETLRALG